MCEERFFGCSVAESMCGENEDISGRALLPLLNRIANLRACMKAVEPKAAHD